MLDTIILSTNDNPVYKEHWPIVRKAWKLCFPNVKIKLAYVSSNPDMMMPYHEDIIILKEIPGIKSANLTKVARLYLASLQGNDICMIQDIDLIPLTREYTKKILSFRQPNEYLCVGGSIYAGSKDDGKFPMAFFTAEGHLFHRLCNPDNANWENYVHQFIGMKVFDKQEDISSQIDNRDPMCFSDESLVRALFKIRNIPKNIIHHVSRCMDELEMNRLDGCHWNFSLQKLHADVYYEAHALRPLSKFKKELDHIMNYLVRKYG